MIDDRCRRLITSARRYRARARPEDELGASLECFLGFSRGGTFDDGRGARRRGDVDATLEKCMTDCFIPCCEFADGKTFKKPRRPFEKDRLDAELKIVGEFGLRNKRELWRVQFALNKLRNAARVLLTLDEKDPKRIFEGEAIIRRMRAYGLLDETQDKLDYVLALTPETFLERRLQTLVFKLGLAKSVHHARVLIRQRHIRVGKQIVNVPSFLVRTDSQKHIDFALNSPLGGGRPGRVKRKRAAAAAGGDDEEEEE